MAAADIKARQGTIERLKRRDKDAVVAVPGPWAGRNPPDNTLKLVQNTTGRQKAANPAPPNGKASFTSMAKEAFPK